MSTVLQGLFKPIDRVLVAIHRRRTGAIDAGSKTVNLAAHGSITVDAAYDFTGDTCLRANLLTKMALDHCAPGATLEIATDNLASVETIPFMLPGHGCVHLATVRTGSGWQIYARKEERRQCNR